MTGAAPEEPDGKHRELLDAIAWLSRQQNATQAELKRVDATIHRQTETYRTIAIVAVIAMLGFVFALALP